MGGRDVHVTAYTFLVLGTPLGEPRARARGMLIGGKARARVYRDTGADVWKRAVADACADLAPPVPIDGPVAVELRFTMPRPKSRKRDEWHTSKPDADNLAKAVLDVMTRCGWWADDSRVALLSIWKQYQSPGTDIGCHVTVIEVEK